MLRDIVTLSMLKIINDFCRKKNIYKYTWTARGDKSTIYYIMTIEKINGQVRDTRVDIETSHCLVPSFCTRYKNSKTLSKTTKIQKEK